MHMNTEQTLDEKLHRIDGHGYKSYKAIKGEYQFPGFIRLIDIGDVEKYLHALQNIQKDA